MSRNVSLVGNSSLYAPKCSLNVVHFFFLVRKLTVIITPVATKYKEMFNTGLKCNRSLAEKNNTVRFNNDYIFAYF